MMVEMICRVRKYGADRRHIEVGRDYYDDLPIDSKVVVIDKETYDKLHKRLLDKDI